MYANVKLEIFRRGIRQKQLARELGLRESLLSKIINGYRPPSETERRMLAAYFNVDEAWLFDGEQSRRTKTRKLMGEG